ncbi:MAG: RNase adapter RapZ [Gammaproteobacteria bacterium]|nr:RNase adapter RapZ [Gammaproteobacteria bacterium]MCF6231181.1 RNase adapter RapZ [Gammaproteobacteria bacterium]
MKLIVVSGYSGSGKSTALHVLEDAGYYCIDNLPLMLLKDFVSQSLGRSHPVENLAVGIDVRNLSSDLQHFPEVVSDVRKLGAECEVLFLDATEPVLQKRFSETRRKHPLSKDNVSLAEAVKQERLMLGAVRECADICIETSNINVRELRAMIAGRVVQRAKGTLSLLLMSFGFKHGAPADVDFIFDVRCLPNPHWESHLRHATGLEKPVMDYLEAQPEVAQMEADIADFLLRWLPRFEAENRSYVTVAIGCTGGQHRSVYCVERLQQQLKQRYPQMISRHRELA